MANDQNQSTNNEAVLSSIEESDKVATERHQELMYMLRGLQGQVARIELAQSENAVEHEAAMKALFDKITTTAAPVIEPVKEPGLKGWAKRWWKPVVTVVVGTAVGVGGKAVYDHYLAGETVTVELPSSPPAYPQ